MASDYVPSAPEAAHINRRQLWWPHDLWQPSAHGQGYGRLLPRLPSSRDSGASHFFSPLLGPENRSIDATSALA